jgi:uncharacterized protein involved in exopolysaccharide biosynthesis
MLAEEYVQQNLELRKQNMERSLEWLGQELARQKTIVEASERAMAQYREDQNALSLEDRQNIVIARLNQLNDAATRPGPIARRRNRSSRVSRVSDRKPPGFDSRDSAEPVHPVTQSAGRRARTPEGTAHRALR